MPLKSLPCSFSVLLSSIIFQPHNYQLINMTPIIMPPMHNTMLRNTTFFNTTLHNTTCPPAPSCSVVPQNYPFIYELLLIPLVLVILLGFLYSIIRLASQLSETPRPKPILTEAYYRYRIFMTCVAVGVCALLFMITATLVAKYNYEAALAKLLLERARIEQIAKVARATAAAVATAVSNGRG
jgi:hypothetical protein